MCNANKFIFLLFFLVESVFSFFLNKMLHPLTFFSYTFSLKSRRQSLVSSLDDSL